MHAPDQIDEQGFRIRRDQPTRVEAFVDAAFAIERNLGFLAVAATSLLLALTLPMSNEHPLLYALPGMTYMLIWPYSLWLRRRTKRLLRASVA